MSVLHDSKHTILHYRPIVERFNIVLYLCDTYTICLVYKIKESDATSTILAVPYRWNHLLPLPHRGVSLRHIYYTWYGLLVLDMPLWYPKGLSKISLILCLVCAGIVQVIIHYVFDAYHIRMIVRVVMHYVFYAYHIPLSSICHIWTCVT